MSNRNFDSRVIIQRLQNQNYARNLYSNVTSGLATINNPQTSNGDSSRYNSYISGAQTEYFRGLIGGGETISIGGIVNISPFLPISTTAPSPSPAPGPTVPSAPNITSITPSNTQLTVNFTAGSDGGSSITDYEYSTDNGISFTSTGVTTSPIVITGLANGTTYQVAIRAINSVGPSSASNIELGTPYTIPSSPSITSIIGTNDGLTINFTAPISDGGSPITNYEYSTDNGISFISAGTTISPILISGLNNGTTYQVKLRAINIAGSGGETVATPGTPVSTIVTFNSPLDTTIAWSAPSGVYSVEYLVVGGGGGGGNGYDTGGGGGGGGGMVLTGSLSTIPNSAYSVIVGAGGSGGANVRSNNNGINGNSSIFHTITALGGGFGKGSRTQPGGSGLGGTGAINPNISSIGGNGGGNVGTTVGGCGGGGGGSGGNGTNGIGSTNSPGSGGVGGNGITSFISGSSQIYGIGGNGARGNTNVAGINGIPNTGNGGSGGSNISGSSNGGGNGGSGIIILKY